MAEREKAVNINILHIVKSYWRLVQPIKMGVIKARLVILCILKCAINPLTNINVSMQSAVFSISKAPKEFLTI